MNETDLPSKRQSLKGYITRANGKEIEIVLMYDDGIYRLGKCHGCSRVIPIMSPHIRALFTGDQNVGRHERWHLRCAVPMRSKMERVQIIPRLKAKKLGENATKRLRKRAREARY